MNTKKTKETKETGPAGDIDNGRATPLSGRRYGMNCGPAFESATDAARHGASYGTPSASEPMCLAGSFT